MERSPELAKPLLGLQALTLTHGDGIVAFVFRDNNAAGVVDNAITDGVGESWLTNFLVPALAPDKRKESRLDR